MFEGTDLSLAYSGSMYEVPSSPVSQPAMESALPPQPMLPPASGNRPDMSVTSQKDYAPPMKYRPPPPPVPEYEESPPSPGERYAQRNPSTYEEPYVSGPSYSTTFWDRLAARKTEVYKLFAFSLVIVLAVAIHYVASHYLNQYISKSFLSDFQEFLVRLSYPVIVILVIWTMKAL